MKGGLDIEGRKKMQEEEEEEDVLSWFLWHFLSNEAVN